MLKNLWINFVLRMKSIFTSRLFVVIVLAFCMFSFLVMRLFKLQIVEGESFQEEYNQTSTKNIEENYTRGTIYDRNGTALAYNKLSYVVQLIDNGSYSAYDRNLMIVRLIKILDKHKENFNTSLSIAYENGEYIFTTTTEKSLIRFLKDVGLYSTSSDATKEQSKSLDYYTPEYVVQKLSERYGIGYTVENGRKVESYTLSEEELLKVLNVRYALSLKSYQKYIPVIVSSDISEKTVSDIMEHQYELLGVSIGTDSIRVYKDPEYFSHIIGYTGQVSKDDLKNLDSSYSEGDVIGKTGIESSFEKYLKGVKGLKKLVVDSQGIVRSETVDKESEAGKDVYLTIDYDTQVAAYSLLEQHLADILLSKIVNYDWKISDNTASSDIMIPIKDVYYQLINNNIISIKAFSNKDASDVEKKLYDEHEKRLEQLIEKVCEIMLDDQGKVNKAYSEDVENSLNYIFDLLKSQQIIKSDEIDTSSSLYKSWVNDEISLRNFLIGALSEGWINVTKLNLNNKYADTEETMDALVNTCRESLMKDEKYSKKVYRYLIDDETITGCDLCLVLFDQKVLKYNEKDYNSLKNGGKSTSFSFIRRKIKSLEITPANLALDPCSGSVVLTDVKTGEVRAMVSYPSYDNNRITSDNTYLLQLSNDQSTPLYSRATQTKIAPGSTFKVITALAGMKENVISPYEKIRTSYNGIFTGAGYKLKCSISPNNHGTLGIQEALEKSCNYFFSEVAYRLALDSDGNYTEKKGIEEIRKYSEEFGLGQKSGVEVLETAPSVTNSDAVPSGIGQGTHAYTNTQLNRYVTTIANRGEVLDLNLVKKITKSNGKVVETSKKKVISNAEFTTEQWNTVYEGMYRAVNNNTKYSKWFSRLDVKAAGKTGTAQEDKKRGNHANFICFAPYDSPEVAISVSLPYGYTAANSVSIASDVLAYYYKKIDLKTILSNKGEISSNSSEDN